MSFPLAGNGHIKRVVENALRENRIPHAIIIEGAKGEGKHTLCSFIASAAICEGENPPCSSCRSCELRRSNSHPDVTVISPEEGKKSISVGQIRELRAEAYVKPHIAKRRIFIIDKADTMNESSQNALLKVLEEPPGEVAFILLAESKTALLETIISRCVVLSLSSPDEETALDFIKKTTDFDEQNIKEALRLNKNNIGLSLGALKGNTENKNSSAAERFLDCFLERDSFGMLSVTVPFEKNRVSADLFLKELKYITAARLRQCYKGFDGPYLSALYEELLSSQKSLSANINLGLFFASLVSNAKKIQDR